MSTGIGSLCWVLPADDMWAAVHLETGHFSLAMGPNGALERLRASVETPSAEPLEITADIWNYVGSAQPGLPCDFGYAVRMSDEWYMCSPPLPLPGPAPALPLPVPAE